MKQSSVRARRCFKVTIVGDANFDIILYGLPEELMPKRELLASEMQIPLDRLQQMTILKAVLESHRTRGWIEVSAR